MGIPHDYIPACDKKGNFSSLLLTGPSIPYARIASMNRYTQPDQGANVV
jgi:hypothetical protein